MTNTSLNRLSKTPSHVCQGEIELNQFVLLQEKHLNKIVKLLNSPIDVSTRSTSPTWRRQQSTPVPSTDTRKLSEWMSLEIQSESHGPESWLSTHLLPKNKSNNHDFRTWETYRNLGSLNLILIFVSVTSSSCNFISTVLIMPQFLWAKRTLSPTWVKKLLKLKTI